MTPFLINLKRRPDRLAESLAEFAKTNLVPTVFEAVDANDLDIPPTWTSPRGGYGCRESHCKLLQSVLDSGHDTALVFEDDVTFCRDFDNKFKSFLDVLPADWDAFFLGGEHLLHPPVKLSAGLMKVRACHRTHAYAIRGPYLRFVLDLWRHCTRHIDWVWAANQTVLPSFKHYPEYGLKDWNVYCPEEEWLCGQRSSFSDITGMTNAAKWWPKKRVIDPERRKHLRGWR